MPTPERLVEQFEEHRPHVRAVACCRLTMPRKDSQGRIEHIVQVLPYVLGNKTPHKIAVLLQ
jgi:hypothetical protein